MRKSFRDGKIIVACKNYEDVVYDVASNDLHVRFDGKGGITDYTLNNQSVSYVKQNFLNLYIDKKSVGVFCDKTVELAGRTLKIILKKDGVRLTVFQFIPPKGNAVFYEFKASKAGDYDIVLDLGQAKNGFSFAANVENNYVHENASIYLRTDKSARFLLSYENDAANCRKLLSRFAEFKKQVVDEFRSVKIPASAKTEKDKAVYVSAVFSALENYIEIGSYKSFSAACIYADPVRTYFDTDYWATLAMIKNRPDLVRNAILTLASGIKENGECPAGITFRLQSRTPSYYDSASFFVLMVYDYINRTGDLSLLNETVGGKTVYQYCLLTIDKLSGYEDETSLIRKPGRYNRRDWADEINRTGYVTYVELLYARALDCLSRIVGTRDKPRARRYHGMFLKTKDAINRLLWDDEKGYYVNYKSGDFVEDNLSVDTILAVLFGISDEKQTERLLDNISRLLETRNNRDQQAGDFGVMSVFPFYRGVDRCSNRSSREYSFCNGAAWPYWSALVAYAQLTHGRDHTYALTSPFDWCVKRGIYTLCKYYSPFFPHEIVPLDTANSVFAFVYDWQDADFFCENEEVWKTKS